jgi:hypothetical protein
MFMFSCKLRVMMMVMAAVLRAVVLVGAMVAMVVVGATAIMMGADVSVVVKVSVVVRETS